MKANHPPCKHQEEIILFYEHYIDLLKQGHEEKDAVGEATQQAAQDIYEMKFLPQRYDFMIEFKNTPCEVAKGPEKRLVGVRTLGGIERALQNAFDRVLSKLEEDKSNPAERGETDWTCYYDSEYQWLWNIIENDMYSALESARGKFPDGNSEHMGDYKIWGLAEQFFKKKSGDHSFKIDEERYDAYCSQMELRFQKITEFYLVEGARIIKEFYRKHPNPILESSDKTLPKYYDITVSHITKNQLFYSSTKGKNEAILAERSAKFDKRLKKLGIDAGRTEIRFERNDYMGPSPNTDILKEIHYAYDETTHSYRPVDESFQSDR